MNNNCKAFQIALGSALLIWLIGGIVAATYISFVPV